MPKTRKSAPKIRKMTPADLRWVTKAGMRTPELHSQPGYGEASFVYSSWIKSPKVTCLVAEENGKRVGHAVVALRTTTPKAGFLVELAVDKAARGRGIGTALLKEVLKVFERSGCGYVWLLARADKPETIRFWKRRGLKSGYTFKYMYALRKDIRPRNTD